MEQNKHFENMKTKKIAKIKNIKTKVFRMYIYIYTCMHSNDLYNSFHA